MMRASPGFGQTNTNGFSNTHIGAGFDDTGQDTTTHSDIGDFSGNSAGGIAFSDTHIGASA